jgi:hypothetical protein
VLRMCKDCDPQLRFLSELHFTWPLTTRASPISPNKWQCCRSAGDKHLRTDQCDSV